MPVVVDADNPDPVPIKRVTESASRPSMLQQTPSTSNQREGLSVHEINMEKGVDEFSKIMDQFGVEHH